MSATARLLPSRTSTMRRGTEFGAETAWADSGGRTLYRAATTGDSSSSAVATRCANASAPLTGSPRPGTYTSTTGGDELADASTLAVGRFVLVFGARTVAEGVRPVGEPSLLCVLDIASSPEPSARVVLPRRDRVNRALLAVTFNPCVRSRAGAGSGLG